jgi:NTE family protein
MAPSVAAVVVDLTSWRVVYLLGVPVALAVVIVGRRVLLEPARPQTAGGRLDLLGVPTGTVAIGLIALAIVQGPSWGWTSPAILGALVGAAILLPAFVLRSLRQPTPLLDVRIFKVRTVWSANVTNLFMSMIGLSIWFLWPLFLTGIWGYSLVQAGLAITPGPAAAAATPRWAGRVADRRGAPTVLGLGSLVPVMVMLWMVFRFGPEPDYWGTFFPATLMFGIGFGMTFAPLNGAALRGVDAAAFGQVNAAFNTVRNLGGGLGVALMVAVLGNEKPIPMANFDRAFTIFAVLALVPALVITIAYPRGSALASAGEVVDRRVPVHGPAPTR